MSPTTALIRKLLSLGMTQTAIAKRTGIPQPRLSRWAAGQPSVAADDALKLQQLLREVEPQSGPEVAPPVPAETTQEVCNAA